MDAIDNPKKRNKKALFGVLLSVLVCIFSGVAFFSDSVTEKFHITVGGAEAKDFDCKIQINNQYLIYPAQTEAALRFMPCGKPMLTV